MADDPPPLKVSVWAPCLHGETAAVAQALIDGRHLEDVVNDLWVGDGWSSYEMVLHCDQWVRMYVRGSLDAEPFRSYEVVVEGDTPLLVYCEALRQVRLLVAP
jgi:hypothetical protein